MGYIIRRLLLLFNPGFFQDLKKISVGGGGPQVFCWYIQVNLGGFLK